MFLNCEVGVCTNFEPRDKKRASVSTNHRASKGAVSRSWVGVCASFTVGHARGHTMFRRTYFSAILGSFPFFVLACGSSSDSLPPPASIGGMNGQGGLTASVTTGGVTSSTGGANTGGTTATSTTGRNSTGGASPGGAGGGPATGGSPTGSTGGRGAASGGADALGGGNTTGGSSAKNGTTATGGTAGSVTTGITGGGSLQGGTSPTGGSSAKGGTAATGGVTTTIGGSSAKGGASTAGGVTSTGGATGTSVSVSSTCKITAWPAPKGSTVNISGTKSVTTYDGGGALHEGNLNDCSVGDQSSTNAIFEVADGGSVKNVIFGKNVGDGIHCLGSCTIDNVWFPYICDDAITINKDGASSGTSTISNSGFKGARDKTIQHNGGNSTLNITNVYVEVAGKLYRSCGSGGGCTTSAKHTVNISNLIAIGVDQVAGVSENDAVTLTNICTFRTPTLCNTYKVNSDSDSTKGANGTGEGPSPNCSYKASDTHALVDRVTGATLTTDVVCTGSNSAKTGSTATACVTGFEDCLKVCAPGSYGFKELTCSGGTYTSPATGGCVLVSSSTDSAAAAALAGTNSSKATSNVTKNASCSTQWAWGKDSSNSANYCVCTEKPGYYQQSSGSAQPASWMVWDCQSQWW